MSANMEAAAPVAGPSYSVTMRIVAPPVSSLLSDLSRTIGAAGAHVVAVDHVAVSAEGAVVDVTFHARDDDHVAEIAEEVTRAGWRVRRTSDRTFLSHLGGTIGVQAKTQIRTRDDLSVVYTPGVAKIALAIAADPRAARNLTIKGNSVAIVTNGTAVLGLGPLGPLAALPVMEGKAALFKTFADIDAFPICLEVSGTDQLIEVTKALAVGFGAINLEDIASPTCFEVERRLQDELDIPVFHDDQHGTATVVLAGLINACRITERSLSSLRAVVVGIGAAGHAICNALLDAGVRDLVPIDVDGPLNEKTARHDHERQLLERLLHPVDTVREAFEGADVFIGVSRRGAIDPELIKTMAPRPIVFALSNPDPELLPHEVPEDALLATGRSDLPNQVNNALCFPGFFRGALDARATRVTVAMRQAAAVALADAVSDDQRAIGLIIPSIFYPSTHRRVADAVREASLPVSAR